MNPSDVDPGIERLPADLERLFAAERPVPGLDQGARLRLYARLQGTLTLPASHDAGPGAADAVRTGGPIPGGVLAALITAAVALLAIALMVRPDRTRDAGSPAAASLPAAADVRPPRTPWPPPRFVGGASLEMAADPDTGAPTVPEWFGQHDVEPRRIAGEVRDGDRPAPHTPVLLESILSTGDRRFAREVQTDEQGRFDFGTQPAWFYLVTATAAGRQSANVWLHLADPTNQPASDALRLELAGCTARVRGVVTGEDGAPLSAEVRLADPDHFGIAAVGTGTDAHGRFELCRPAGPTRLQIGAEGHGTLYLRTLAAADPPPIAVTLGRQGVVEGQAVRAETNAPIPGAQVAVTEIDPPSSYRTRPADRTTVADGRGRFRIDGLAPGSYEVDAWAIDARMGDESKTRALVHAGRSTSGIVARLATTSEVEVLVVAGGRPLPGFTVGLCRRSPVREVAPSPDLDAACSYGVVTQEDGRATIHGVFPGANAFRPLAGKVRAPATVNVGRTRLTGVVVEVDPPLPRSQIAPAAAPRGTR